MVSKLDNQRRMNMKRNLNKTFAYIWVMTLVMMGGPAFGQRDNGGGNGGNATTQHVEVRGNVYGGGNLAPVAGNTSVLVDQQGCTIGTVSGGVHAGGDVYGGGALADVGTNGDNTTTVNILNGIINGNVYGGGLGKLVPEVDTIAAKVYGKVYVNIGAKVNNTLTGNASFSVSDDLGYGNVFGCNNICGTPLDSVFVNIYMTFHTSRDNGNGYPSSITTMELLHAAPNTSINYAIKAVYGGGNMASYEPNLNDDDTPKCTTVHVWECQENTVQTIYGGGNAADAGTASKPADTRLIIDGGRFDRIFGGGNGYSVNGNHDHPYYVGSECSTEISQTRCPDYNPGANIFGKASTFIYGGLYRQVFGGSNQYGDIGTVALAIQKNCDNLLIEECFGGGNEADISSNVETTLLCTTTDEDYHIGNFYGGSNMASINGNVTLNVYGGKYTNVFGGSKGVRGDDPGNSISANISDNPATIDEVEGNVTLNLYGGTMVNAFGGSDAYGNISGNITVNLLQDGDCPLVIDTIYGAGQDAAYTPLPVNGKKIVSPVVNLWHGQVGEKNAGNVVTVPGCVFGGGKGNGAVVTAHPKVIIGDTITTGDDASVHIGYIARVLGHVFGGGNAAEVDGIDSVLMLKANSEVVNLFGGGNKAAADSTVVRMTAGAAVDTIFGGGNLAGLSGAALVEVSAGTSRGGVYGGSNKSGNVVGDIAVNVTGGTIGATNRAANIHGGGYGAATETQGHVTVNFGEIVLNSSNEEIHTSTPVVYGDIYGGSALGSVNIANDTTTVNILNGEVKKTTSGTITGGNIYGGGLGDKDNDIAALVKGKVYVNIGTIETGDLKGNAVIEGSVFGCNNQHGSPQDSVFVNIFKTHHTDTPINNTYPTGINTIEALALNSASQAYAIQAVYGGGNEAAYTPPFADGKPRSATVHVYGCNTNTIEDVYGGGNAANVGTSEVYTDTYVIIDGGRINRVFGGGKGDNTSNPQVAANIHGTATTTINAGLIDTIFGGGNMKGTIDSISLVLAHGSSCTDHIYNQVFGGANEAELGNNLVTTINCGVGTIGDVYGGSNKAKIRGDVKLSINGGDIRYVYGGSRGDNSHTPNIDAEIDGNTQLNIFGGTIRHAFGGSNLLGSVKGQITVNVLDTVSLCQLSLDTVYGGGNLAPYQPTDPTISSPSVNIIHGTVNKFVYGGGLGSSAVVTANPKVTIGYDVTTMSSLVTSITASGYSLPDSPQAKVIEDVFGGGDAAAVTGSTTVTLQQANSLVNRLFGGGNNITTAGEGVNGSNVRMTGGTVGNNLYGGCNENGTVKTTSSVIITNGTVTGSVFGGGYGQGTSVTGKATVHISGTTTAVNGDVFGGGDNGTVNGGTEVKIQAAEEP